MAQPLTTRLIATTLQKLEAIRHNEAEVLSDEECYKRAEEVAEAALQAIAVCTKYLLSRTAEAHIDGLGTFYIGKELIQFAPEEDVLQYALLKQQDPEQQQLALRNAFVQSLSQAQGLIPFLELSPTTSVSVDENMKTAEETILNSIFGEVAPNNFDRAVSLLLNKIIGQLREAGVELRIADTDSGFVESPEVTADWSPAPAVDSAETAAPAMKLKDLLRDLRKEEEQRQKDWNAPMQGRKMELGE